MRWIVLGVFVLGCGTDLTADQACSDVAASRCSKLSSCSATDLERRWGDFATCSTREKLACMQSLAAHATAATPTTTETCSTALEQSTCVAFLSGVSPPTQCFAQKGVAANGAACAFSAQCSSGFCALTADSLCGTCAAMPAAGDSCATTGCGPTLSCVKATMLCQAPVASGGACDKTLPCGTGLSCVGSTMTAMGTCMADVTTVGATCDPQRKTGPTCDAGSGLACNTMTKMCVMQPDATAGMPCGLINNVETRCAAGATCETPTGQTAGTCVAPAADGAACDATNGPDCLFPAKCVAGTCQLPGSMTCG
jgi:hypothetical protein